MVVVQTYPLRRAYRPALFGGATAELDRVAARLAALGNARVTERATTTVAGRKIRAYRFAAGVYDARLGFVLVGKREYQLYCRAPRGAGDPDGACGLLFSSFSLS